MTTLDDLHRAEASGATDLDKAIAAAREASERYQSHSSDWKAHEAAEELRDLLAALDAARGQSVATVVLRGERYGHGHFIEAQLQIDPAVELPQGTKLFAAPPAAAALPPRTSPEVLAQIAKDISELRAMVGEVNALTANLEEAPPAAANLSEIPNSSFSKAPPAEAVPDDVARDAARFRFLVEHCSGGYEATEEQPAECHLVFEWQQSKPNERYWTVVNAIDAAMLAAAQAERAKGEQ